MNRLVIILICGLLALSSINAKPVVNSILVNKAEVGRNFNADTKAVIAETNVNGAQSIAIDISRDYEDRLGDDTKMEVAVNLLVRSGAVFLGSNEIVMGTISSLQVEAVLTEKVIATGEPVNTRNVQMIVAVGLREVNSNSQKSLAVETLVREVDGNAITSVDVHLAVLKVDEYGNEIDRTLGSIAIAESMLQALPTSAPAVEDGSDSDSDSDGDSDSDSNGDIATDSDSTKAGSASSGLTQDANESDSDSDDNDESHHDCKLHKFGHWLHKQKFIVKLLIAFAFTIVTFVLMYVLLGCLRVCCCPIDRRHYHNDIKLHYVPLDLNDASEKEKKIIF